MGSPGRSSDGSVSSFIWYSAHLSDYSLSADIYLLTGSVRATYEGICDASTPASVMGYHKT